MEVGASVGSVPRLARSAKETPPCPAPVAAAPVVATPIPTPRPTPVQPLLSQKNIFIGIGALIALFIVIVLIAKMAMSRSSDV